MYWVEKKTAIIKKAQKATVSTLNIDSESILETQRKLEEGTSSAL
jgi:hypothetical protein